MNIEKCAICGNTPIIDRGYLFDGLTYPPRCHKCDQWADSREAKKDGAIRLAAGEEGRLFNIKAWNKKQRKIRKDKQEMDNLRKKVLIVVATIVVSVLAATTGVFLLKALFATLSVLWLIAKVILFIGLSVLGGITLIYLCSLIAFLFGKEHTVFEKYFVSPFQKFSTRRKERKDRDSWDITSKQMIEEIGKRLTKLKPKDKKTLSDLQEYCKGKLDKLMNTLNKGDDITNNAKLFLSNYSRREEELKKTEKELAEEIETLPDTPLSESVRSMKASELLEVQAQLKELRAKKKHHQYMVDMVNSTRLLITDAKTSIEYALNELERKAERESVLGG